MGMEGNGRWYSERRRGIAERRVTSAGSLDIEVLEDGRIGAEALYH